MTHAPDLSAPANDPVFGANAIRRAADGQAFPAHEMRPDIAYQLVSDELFADGMARLMQDQTFTAVEYEGVTHDCGDKIGLLRANVALALKRPDLGDAARAAIAALL